MMTNLNHTGSSPTGGTGDAAINSIFNRRGLSYRIENGQLSCDVGSLVPSPPPEVDPDEAVTRALEDATALLEGSGAASGIDRAHTALHGYLRNLCVNASLSPPDDATTARLFKILRNGHPALRPRGPRADDITRMLNALATVLDALSPIRNKATLAHPNPLLDEPEALAALNATRTIFRYIQDSIRRDRHGDFD